jgi:two-component system alkaline phosphatase synthesis response regulator PhoP
MAQVKKILICEDEEILLTALKFRLQKQGYELLLTGTVEEAKQLARQEKPDIVVTDIELPKATGLDLIRYLRNDLSVSTPVIVITPLEDEDQVLKVMKEGGDDFVTKPFKPVELVLRIRCILQALENA